jgi:hypothetical protein
MSSRKKSKKGSKKEKNAYVNNLDESNNKDNSNTNLQKSTINSLPTLDYIKVTVQKEVQQGLLKVAREKPSNPIEYLGKYLIGEAKKKYNK